MKIIHQTAEYVVVCKAAGEDSEHDLPEMLAEQNGDKATDYYVVHRLDQAVAGILVLARNRVTAAELSRQLTENRLRKTYLCVVPGVPAPASGEMQDLLYQDKMKRKMFPVKRKRAGVKEASLRYHVLETKPTEKAPMPLTLVEVELQTGRFHQIRCQFSSRGLPLAGDCKYGAQHREMEGIGLWSHLIAFRHPQTDAPVSFQTLCFLVLFGCQKCLTCRQR